MPNQKNQDGVKALEAKLKEFPNLLLTGYQGLTTPELAGLRAKLAPLGSEYSVVKNTLTRIALKNAGLEDFAKFFTGPTALAFQKGDPAQLSKAVVEYAKGSEKLKILAGWLDGKLLTEAEIKKLATLPSREVLLTMLAVSLNSPMQKLAVVLNAPTQKLAQLLSALAAKKAKEAPAAA
jgi:large subunit ribosomal protein L10